jgi:hypothetical protein
MMLQTLQVLQVILFAITVLTLLAIGVLILARAVSIVNRRWFLLVLIPLLLANTLSILSVNRQFNMDWRTWLILAADLVLIVGGIRLAQGYQVYGLSAEEVEQVLTEVLQQQGFTIEMSDLKKQDLWGRTRGARLLRAKKEDQTHDFWITARFNEVLIQSEHAMDAKLLYRVLPALRETKVPYEFKAHAAGVLYIILAVVFAVLAWIFFFEPRLILIE